MNLPDRLVDALHFEAPYVIERLISDGVAPNAAEAEALFEEAKRYLVLCEASPGLAYGMYSALVDAAWHTFILFTSAYTEYGQRYFGNYLHHVPASAQLQGGAGGASPHAQEPSVASFDDFARRYSELYGEQLPPVWYDETGINPGRRVLNHSAGTLAVTLAGGIAEMTDAAGAPVISISALARDAIDFIARTRDFFVREIPGLTDEERVGVVQALVRSGLVRLAS